MLCTNVKHKNSHILHQDVIIGPLKQSQANKQHKYLYREKCANCKNAVLALLSLVVHNLTTITKKGHYRNYLSEIPFDGTQSPSPRPADTDYGEGSMMCEPLNQRH